MNAPAIQNRPKTFETVRKEIAKPMGNEDDRKRRIIGVGRAPEMEKIRQVGKAGCGDLISQMQAFKACPVYNMPVIEQVRQTFSGPLLDADIQKTFGAGWDPFAAGLDPAGASFVETTMAQPGQLQTYTLVCAIGAHVEPFPFCATGQGNGWNHPAGTVAQPPSPDVFTGNDVANGALGAAFTGGAPTQTMIPAVFEAGWWINLGLWAFVRAMNLRWMIGQHTNIMDEQARHTVYMPPNAQEGSASSSQVDLVDLVRQTNNYYNSLGAAFELLKINFLRLGSTGTGTANLGVFRPSRALEVVGATYGGMDLRSTLGTKEKEFRTLTVPYVITPGVPIGLKFQVTDPVQLDLMKRYFSITQGFDGSIPPQVTDAADVLAALTATGTGVMNEQTFDATPALQAQTVLAQRMIFKYGEWKMGLLLKGFEVDSNWADVLRADPDLRAAVMADCGCAWSGGR